MTIEEYYNKRKSRQLDEASELVKRYREVYGKEPDEKALHEFFYLFEDGTNILHSAFENQMQVCGNIEKSYEVLKQRKPLFRNMNDFLEIIK